MSQLPFLTLQPDIVHLCSLPFVSLKLWNTYLEVQVLSKLTAPHQHPLGVDAVRAASPEGL